MGKNLLARLRKNEDIDSVHELVEDFIVGGITLDFIEGIKEKYQRAKQTIKNFYNSLKSYR